MSLITRRSVLTLLAAGAAAPLAGQRNLAGSAQLQLALESLGVLGRVLMVAAHPDDENTAALAYLARGRKMEVAYLSLTRGEGGQNLIGSEQGDLLGMIRTQELLAARRIDGARQYFTRAIDFGFSKTAEETLRKWGKDNVLHDVVWVMRQFRPDLVICVFSGTPRDGHGHHQASAMLAREAFHAAADPKRFPEQLKHVEPWQAKRVLFNVFFWSREAQEEAAKRADRVSLPIGDYDPLLGCSYTEIAGMSRSEHRSQGMGSAERRGEAVQYLLPVEGEPAKDDPFLGIDTTWARVPGGAEIGQMLAKATAAFAPQRPEAIIPDLLAVRKKLTGMPGFWPAEKRKALDEVIAQCAGLWLDATCAAERVLPGAAVEVEAVALLRRNAPGEWREVALDGPLEARVHAPVGKNLEENKALTTRLRLTLPAATPPSQPYWIQQPHDGNLYRVDDLQLLGQPESPPAMQVRFRLQLHGAELEFTRPVVNRYVDPVQGERTRAVVVVPPVAIELPQSVWVFPDAGSREAAVELRANQAGVRGTLALRAPEGWVCEPSQRTFAMAESDERATLTFLVTPPARAARGEIRAVADCGGMEVTSGMVTLVYPHFPHTTVFPAARATAVKAEIATKARRVGYIMGAGDEIPEALRQLGCEVTLLDNGQLSKGDLSSFDAIVTGVRAFNTRPALAAAMGRLLEYAAGGGTLVVQYNVLEFRANPTRVNPLAKLGPYPIQIGRARIAVEDAPVRILNPDSPLLAAPNRITLSDFEGWVQERGLYFPSSWDERYQVLWESADPGEQPLAGGNLYTKLGKGAYVFSCYSWFRQLPAGVSGAFRIFANFLSAAKTAQ